MQPQRFDGGMKILYTNLKINLHDRCFGRSRRISVMFLGMLFYITHAKKNGKPNRHIQQQLTKIKEMITHIYNKDSNLNLVVI